MEELDFYQQRILNSGVFGGSALVQSSGEIGGTRHVFVKLQSSSKRGLVYPTVGGVLANPFKGNAKVFAGDLFEYNPGIKSGAGATIKVLKTYELAEAISTETGATTSTVKIVRDGFRHVPFVGDYMMVAPKTLATKGTAATVTAVSATTDATAGDVWVVTLSAVLSASKGDILVEASAGTGSVLAMVTNPNSYAPSDADFVYTPAASSDSLDGVRYLYTPCLANTDTVLYADKMSPMPACVTALNTSKVEGWFSL